MRYAQVQRKTGLAFLRGRLGIDQLIGHYAIYETYGQELELVDWLTRLNATIEAEPGAMVEHMDIPFPPCDHSRPLPATSKDRIVEPK